MKFIINILLSGLIVFVLAKILNGVHVQSYFNAVLVAIVIAILNAVVRPVLSILTIPINILTLGLFSLVITAIIILLASAILKPDFQVDGFFPALIFGVALAILQSILGMFRD